MIDLPTWLREAELLLPDFDLGDNDPGVAAILVCQELAYAIDGAHKPPEDRDFLLRGYNFIRRSIRIVDDPKLRGWISDYFWDLILTLEHSRKECLNYLDWGDVSLLMDGFTNEPMFQDIANLDSLVTEWKKRWSRNQKLPSPVTNSSNPLKKP